MTNYTTAQSHSQSIISSLFKSMYMQMAAALTLTGITAYFLSNSDDFMYFLVTHPSSLWIAFFAQLGIVIWLSSRVMSMSISTATLLFVLYSVLTGATFSTIFLAFDLGTIASAFFVTAGTFFAMSVVGYVTKMDLSRVGNVLYMMLIGLIIATIVNIFWANDTLYWIINYVGVIIFVGLIAYDTQKIKQIFYDYGSNDEMGQKLALYGALSLYLDFINLFLFLLRIFGGSRD